MISKDELLHRLPPYEDKWLLIHPDQTVKDIIKEVLAAHDEFAPYYDNIGGFFDGNDTKDISNKLYNFCKQNLKYNEETEAFQSTSVPQGLLYRGECDCKGYSNFIGGVLDALNRAGKNITWTYRFASYDLLNKNPHHVFIVANDENGKEYWIDPTPGATDLTPVWKVDKKISAVTRSQHIGSINNSIGITSLTVTPVTNIDNINFDGSGRYAGVFNPYLGLSMYRDLGGDRNISENSVAQQINAAISNGPSPGHSYPGDFIKWVYDSNIRSWNFFYPGGIRPGFSAANLLPADWPKLVITNDGRLTFDKQVAVDDWRNAEIHLLTGWAQNLINENDPSAYPIKPRSIKEFSQGLHGDINSMNIFSEIRGSGIFQDIGKAIENTVNFIKDGLLAIVGFVPRNAFLALVGLNVFHMATHLDQSIAAGHWEEIKRTWQDIGGDADKLLNTIQHGSTLPAIEDTSGSGELNTSAAIGDPVTFSAILATAAPIIAILLKYLNKDGRLNDVVSATQAALQATFPEEDFTFLNGVLVTNKTGTPVPVQFTASSTTTSGGIITWIKSNPIPAIGIGAGAAYLLLNKKRRVAGAASPLLMPLLIGAGIFLVVKNKAATQTPVITADQKRNTVVTWARNSGVTLEAIDKFESMSDNEINTFYTYVTQYAIPEIDLPESSQLYTDLVNIAIRYNLPF